MRASNKGLVGWWKFEEGSGTTAADSSGAGNTGSVTGTPTWVTGKLGGAFQFDGSTNNINAANSASLNITGSSITVSMWVKANYPGSYITVLQKTSIYGSGGYLLYTGAGSIQMAVNTPSGLILSGDPPVSPWDNHWHLITGVYDGSNVSIYVDGVLANHAACTGNIYDNSTYDLYVGSSSNSSHYFTGLIDDVRIYNRALSADEVRDLFFTRTTFITSGTTWSVPEDWKSSNNLIEAIGGGGGGGWIGPGGGGGYSKSTNVTLTPNATVGVNVGSAGGSNAVYDAGFYDGGNGGDTYLCNSTSNCASIGGSAVVAGAKGGAGGAYNERQGAGGAAASGVGSTKYSGGTGGEVVNDALSGSGGGGAAGPNGNGANGGYVGPGSSGYYAGSGGGGSGGGTAGGTGTGVNGTIGGNNSSGSGGGSGGVNGGAAAGSGTNGGGGGGDAYQGSGGGAGGSGKEWDSTHGAGGGGGGGGDQTSAGGSGGSYGGGGGGGGLYWPGGSGANGVIAVTYPVTKPVGWWKFNDGTGTSATDSSGNGNTGTLTNGPVWTSVHTGNLALTFSRASSTYVDTANFADNLSDMTVSVWMKTSDNANDAYWRFIVGKMSNYVNTNGWGLVYAGGTGGIVSFLTQDNAGSNYNQFYANTTCGNNQWHHVVATLSGGVAGTITIYIDGASQPLTNFSGGGAVVNDTNSVNVRIGIEGDSDSRSAFDGSIDDVRIYDYAMTSTEVSGLYDQTKDYYPADAGSDLVGWWKFDEGTGTNAADSSGFGHDGTITDGTWTTVKTGNKALTFNGSSSVVNTGTGIGSLITASDGTMSLWFYATYGQGGCGSGQGSALANDGTGGGGYVWLEYDGTNLCAGGYDTANKNMSYAVNKNQWYHAVWVHTGGNLYLYVNGVQVNSMALGNIGNLTNPFWIGETYNTASYFGGSIDDVRVYNRALSSGEVMDLYNQTHGNYLPDPAYGLIAWYKMDDASAASAADATGNGNTGTPAAGVGANASGKRQKAFSFDGGANAYIDVPYANMNFERTDSFSIAGWIYQTDLNDSHALLGRFLPSSPYTGIGFVALGATGGGGVANPNSVVCYLINSFGPSSILVSTATNTDASGKWQHMAMTYDGSSTAAGVHIYIDGVDMPLSVFYDSLSGTIQNTEPWRIGDDYTADYMKGSVDDVRVYGRVLSPSEVRRLYLNGNGMNFGGE